MNISVFDCRSYADFLIDRLKQPGSRGAISRAAKELGCQVSYLSRVMKGELNFTPDQAFKMSRHFKLPKLEAEYFCRLVELARASDPVYRHSIEVAMNMLRKEAKDLTTQIQRPRAADELPTKYFSSWHWSAIHLLSSVEALQTVASLSKRLAISPIQVEKVLDELSRWGLVERVGDRWKYLRGDAHLSWNDLAVNMHHQNWRARALLDAQSPDQKGIHFTVVQTASKKDIEFVKAILLRCINECHSVLGPSEPEAGVVLTFDLFAL